MRHAWLIQPVRYMQIRSGKLYDFQYKTVSYLFLFLELTIIKLFYRSIKTVHILINMIIRITIPRIFRNIFSYAIKFIFISNNMFIIISLPDFIYVCIAAKPFCHTNFKSTDFIFSIIAEEWGFLGCMIVFLLFLIFIFRGFGGCL